MDKPWRSDRTPRRVSVPDRVRILFLTSHPDSRGSLYVPPHALRSFVREYRMDGEIWMVDPGKGSWLHYGGAEDFLRLGREAGVESWIWAGDIYEDHVPPLHATSGFLSDAGMFLSLETLGFRTGVVYVRGEIVLLYGAYRDLVSGGLWWILEGSGTLEGISCLEDGAIRAGMVFPGIPLWGDPGCGYVSVRRGSDFRKGGFSRLTPEIPYAPEGFGKEVLGS